MFHTLISSSQLATMYNQLFKVYEDNITYTEKCENIFEFMSMCYHVSRLFLKVA